MKQNKIREMYATCTVGQKLLLGEGNTDGDIMIIAEFASAKEEAQHQNLLDSEREKLAPFLDAIDVSYDHVYITHLIKYRPYRINSEGDMVSRAVKKDEYALFMPYLKKEIALINPKLIITLGNKTLQQLTGDDSLMVNTEEDQLFVVGIHSKSYKVLPLPHPSQKQFKLDLEQVIQGESDRIKQVVGKNTKKIESNPQEKLDVEDVIEKKADKKRVFHKIAIKKKEEENRTSDKCITMIYAGEGFVDDPVPVALERVSHVLTELGVTIHRIDLYQSKDSMETILDYMNQSVGVVLATNVEWYGVGHRMQEFLDHCFYQGDKHIFERCPLFGIVISRKFYEFDAYTHLLKSWECLGGIEGVSILASIESAAALETNFEWLFGIDKKAEAFFRVTQQKKGVLPRSGQLEKLFIEIPVEQTYERQQIESEPIDKSQKTKNKGIIENYDSYIEKQQEDIHQLGSLFKQKLSIETTRSEEPWPERFKEGYVNQEKIETKIQLIVEDDPRENTVLELNNQNIRAYYGQIGDSALVIMGKKSHLRRIIDGKLTMQRAFMTGEIKAKGDFTLIYKFEGLFTL